MNSVSTLIAKLFFGLLMLGVCQISFSDNTPGQNSPDAETTSTVKEQDLRQAIINNRLKVAEFAVLQQAAAKRGVRVWLFGGLAHSYVINERQRLLGTLPPSRQDYKLTNIIRWTQDLDIVIDGNEDDAKYFEELATTELGFSPTHKKTAWEVRLLTQPYNQKEALIGVHSNFLKRHTDSASLGLIELTTPQNSEEIVTDLKLMAQQTKTCKFLADAAAGKVQLYYSKLHEQSPYVHANPPVLEAVRFLNKSLQNGLAISQEDFDQIKEMIKPSIGQKITDQYARRWLIRNGLKLFYATADLRGTYFLIHKSDLANVLANLEHPEDKGSRYQVLAAELKRLTDAKPLTPLKLDQSQPGKTAQELGIDNHTLEFRTDDYKQYELIQFSMPGAVNLLADNGSVDLVKANDLIQSGRITFITPINLHNHAKEGRDFEILPTGQVRVKNLNAISIDPSLAHVSPITALQYFNLVKDNDNPKSSSYLDYRIIERLKEFIDLSEQAVSPQELETIKKIVHNDYVQKNWNWQIWRTWFSMQQSLKYPELLYSLIRLESFEADRILLQSLFLSDIWLSNPETEAAIKLIVDRLCDPQRKTDSQWEATVKDFFKAKVEKLNNGPELMEKVAENPDLLPYFVERFIGRANPNDWPNYQQLLTASLNVATKLHDKQTATMITKRLSNVQQQGAQQSAPQPSPSSAPTSSQAATNPIPAPQDTTNRSQGNNPTNTAVGNNGSNSNDLNSNNGSNGTNGPAKFKIFNFNKRPVNPNFQNPLAQHPKLQNFKPAQPFFMATTGILTDKITEDLQKGELPIIYGRSNEATEVMDTLVRLKGKNPVLVGEAGVGKTSVMELVAQLIYFNELPVAKQYQSVIKDSVVVTTSPAAISRLAMSNAPTAQAAAVESYIQSIKAVEKQIKQKIVVYVDEMHQFEPAQMEALKATLDSTDGILLVGASTHNELLLMINRNAAFKRRIRKVDVLEFNLEETRQLLKETVVPVLEKKYTDINGNPGKIEDDAVDMAMRRSLEYLPDIRRPDAPYRLLMDAMIYAHRQAGTSAPLLTDELLAEFLVKTLKLPLNPTNLKTFSHDLEKLRQELNEVVIEQDRVVDAMVDLWQKLYFASTPEDSVKVLLIAGPTGAGKSFAARQFAKRALGDEARMLEIDCTKFETGGHSINTVIGAPNGVISSNETKGMLPEFLSGRGKGMNVIVLNEFDKAHPDLAKHLMEMMDTGKLQGGDGQTYYTGRSLVVITTNKGDDHIYPRGYNRALTRDEIEQRLKSISPEDIKKWFMEADKNNLYDTSKQLPASVLQRIDDAVAAAPVSLDGAVKVAKNKIKQTAEGLKNNNRITVEVSDDAVKHLVESTYVPENGVREVERKAQDLVHDALQHATKHLEKNSTIKIDLNAEPNSDKKFYQYNAIDSNGQAHDVATIDAPKAKGEIENPYKDEAIRDQLDSLETRLASHVFGQSEAIKASARAVRTKYIHNNKRPASLLLLGPTGIGKTELGKALAKEVYGSEERMKSFDMGSISWEGDFNNIFSSPKGFVGSGEISPFEKFLMDFPEGGVLMFDEIGNMGGGGSVNIAGHRKIKHDLLMRFYAMLDEGRWASVHGKTYSLEKFLFVFTSNEGQELFAGLPSDDLRLATWQEHRDKDSLQGILTSNGWPEPLIARLGEIILYRPLLKADRTKIAEKEVNIVLKQQIQQHKIGTVEVTPDFYEVVGESFFSHNLGARSIRQFAEKGLTDLIGTALNDLLKTNDDLRNTQLSLSIEDTYHGKLTHEDKSPPVRKVLLTLNAKTGNNTQLFTSDLSSDVPLKRLILPEELRLTAYHEAGHAAVNDPAVSGEVVGFVTIVGQGNYGGYARYEKIGDKTTLTREQVIAKIGGLLAGSEAELKVNHDGTRSAGWTSDLQKARSLAERAVTDFGLVDKPFSMPVVKGKVQVKSPLVQKEIETLLGEGHKKAQELLQERWPVVEKLAEALLNKQVLDRQQLDEILPEQKGIRTRHQQTGITNGRKVSECEGGFLF